MRRDSVRISALNDVGRTPDSTTHGTCSRVVLLCNNIKASLWERFLTAMAAALGSTTSSRLQAATTRWPVSFFGCREAGRLDSSQAGLEAGHTQFQWRQAARLRWGSFERLAAQHYTHVRVALDGMAAHLKLDSW